MVIPILQMRELRHREIKRLTQDYTAKQVAEAGFESRQPGSIVCALQHCAMLPLCIGCQECSEAHIGIIDNLEFQ